MPERELTTPEIVAGTVSVADGETVILPSGRTWGLRATLACAGAATVKGFAHASPAYARPIAGGDLSIPDARSVTLEMRAENPHWEVV